MATRGWRAALVLAVAGLGAAGCTSTVEGTASPAVLSEDPGDGPMTGAPAVGACHRIEVTYRPLDVPEAVDCAEPHTGETAVVMDTGLPDDAGYPTEDDLDYSEESPFTAVCGYEVTDDYLRAQPGEQLFTTSALVLPTEEQWAAGARWVACDVVYGYYDPEPAPGRMAGALEGPDSAAYRLCFSGSPVESDEVPCTEEHWAEPVVGFPDVPEGTPFPADRAARAAVAASCLPDVVDYLDGPLPPDLALDITTDSQEDWESAPFPQCVVVRADGATSTTSVRG